MSRIGNEIYAELRRRITLGVYAPLTPMAEILLAQELGVSRTPIRSALRKLADDGLVVIEPNRVATVAAWTDHDVAEVFDLRILLESHAARLAAQLRRPELVAHLHALNTRLATLIRTKPDQLLQQVKLVNRDFHETILQAAASPRLLAMTRNLFDVERVTGAMFFYDEGDLQRSLAHHRDITLAIEQGESDLAHDLMRVHIRLTASELRQKRHESMTP